MVQEGKAERAIESIRGMLSPKGTVVRDGRGGWAGDAHPFG